MADALRVVVRHCGRKKIVSVVGRRTTLIASAETMRVGLELARRELESKGGSLVVFEVFTEGEGANV